MKKGFTLIELLAVIALLAIIALIAIPAITNSLNKGRENLDKTQVQQIIKGAKDYYAEDVSRLSSDCTCNPPTPTGNEITSCTCPEEQSVTLSELQDAGYLPKQLIDEKKGQSYNLSSEVKVKLTKKIYSDGTFEVSYNYEFNPQ